MQTQKTTPNEPATNFRKDYAIRTLQSKQLKMWKQGIDKNARNRDDISDQVLKAPGNRSTEETVNVESSSF